MKDKPILMSAPMVKAVLAGRKTQTRRIIKPQPYKIDLGTPYKAPIDDKTGCSYAPIPCPYGKIGDLLWVRETHAIENTREYDGYVDLPSDRPIKLVNDDSPEGYGKYHLIPHYRATELEPHIVPFDLEDDSDDRTRWKPSIFMPRWASRITLKIKDIRVEKLKDISEQDCIAEGAYGGYEMLGGGLGDKHHTVFTQYKRIWEGINGDGSWEKNPFVWIVEFEPIFKNIDEVKNAAPS